MAPQRALEKIWGGKLREDGGVHHKTIVKFVEIRPTQDLSNNAAM
jgi:hypothetical protein